MTHVRPAEPRDRDAWAALFLAYGEFYESAFPSEVVDAVWRWILDPAHEVSALVATDDDDRVIGFAHVRRLADTFTAGPGWFLDDLFVEPAARGSGAGEALIAAVKQHAAANGGGTVRWITAHDNATAQRLYDRVATRAAWVTYELES